MKGMLAPVALFLLLGWVTPASAQTACPQGVTPGSARCGPGPGAFEMAPMPPRVPRWRPAWGAFAKDHALSIIGTSTAAGTIGGARRVAIRRCKGAGGRNCEVIFTFRDSCAVIAEPSEVVPGMGTYELSAATVEEASKMALETCSHGMDGRACKIIYSDCTLGYLVR